VLPKKPRPDFPLYVHKSDRWAKKVRGKTLFFGTATTDPNGAAALKEWLRTKDYLLAGRVPPPTVVIDATLQPYSRADNGAIKTKDIDLHRLPWPANR
jgi:hypothetical protein